MVFEPAKLSRASPPLIAGLAEEAARGAVIVCVGAGASKAPEANLPLARDLAARLYRELRNRGQDALVGGCPDDDLLCIADTAQAEGGMTLIQQLIPSLAAFSTAQPNFGHRALALLVLEGAISLTSFNWDDCIERSPFGPPRIQVVISDTDRLNVSGPRILKLHGCITRAGSLLVASSQLSTPPTWVRNELGARLGDSKVIFIGIGDIPAYVRIRLDQLVADIGTVTNIYVVAPDISSDWSSVAPTLPAENKIGLSADEFLSQFINAYVRVALSRVLEWAADPSLRAHYQNRLSVDIEAASRHLIGALETAEGASVIAWLRACTDGWAGPRKVVHSDQVHHCLCGAAVLSAGRDMSFAPADAGVALTLRGGRRGNLRFLFSDSRPGPIVERVARERTKRELRSGRIALSDDVLVICDGHVGPIASPEAPTDVIDPGSSGDLISGPSADWVRIVSADSLMDGNIPDGWAA